MTFFQWIMGILGGGRFNSKPAQTKTRPSPSTAEISPQQKMMDLLCRLEGDVALGSIQMLNLDGLKRALGGDWERARARLHKGIDMALARHLGPDDAYIQSTETLYIVAFGKMTAVESKLMLAMIAYEVQKNLFNEDSSGHCFSVGVAKQMANKRLKRDFEDIEDILAKAAREASADLSPVNAHEINLGVKKTDSKSVVGKKLRKTWTSVSAPPTPAPPWKPFDSPKAPLDKSFYRYKDSIRGVGFEFSPVWMPKSEATKGALCVPVKASVDGSMTYGGKAVPSKTSESAINGAVDFYALSFLLNALTPFEGVRRPVVLPVHFDTLHRPESRKIYIQALQSSGVDTSKNLALEVIGIQEMTPSRSIMGLRDFLPFVKEIIPRTRMEMTSFDHFLGLKSDTVSLDLSYMNLEENKLVPLLQRYVGNAYSRKMKAMVHGVNDKKLLYATTWAGVDYIDGLAVAGTSVALFPDAPWKVEGACDSNDVQKALSVGVT